MMPLLGLAFGANMNKPIETIQQAVGVLARTPGLTLLGCSDVIITQPVNCPMHTPEFYNAVALYSTQLKPLELLTLTQALEDASGRLPLKQRIKNAARPLDVDILFWGSSVVHYTRPHLEIPHPRMKRRAFVQTPLLQVLHLTNHTWVHPIPEVGIARPQ